MNVVMESELESEPALESDQAPINQENEPDIEAQSTTQKTPSISTWYIFFGTLILVTFIVTIGIMGSYYYKRSLNTTQFLIENKPFVFNLGGGVIVKICNNPNKTEQLLRIEKGKHEVCAPFNENTLNMIKNWPNCDTTHRVFRLGPNLQIICNETITGQYIVPSSKYQNTESAMVLDAGQLENIKTLIKRKHPLQNETTDENCERCYRNGVLHLTRRSVHMIPHRNTWLLSKGVFLHICRIENNTIVVDIRHFTTKNKPTTTGIGLDQLQANRLLFAGMCRPHKMNVRYLGDNAIAICLAKKTLEIRQLNHDGTPSLIGIKLTKIQTYRLLSADLETTLKVARYNSNDCCSLQREKLLKTNKPKKRDNCQ